MSWPLAALSDVAGRGMLASLHELLRGLDAADPARVRRLAQARPQHLYEGLLTVLLRLIFILYAEDRALMPSQPGGTAAALYEQGYALGALHLRLRDDVVTDGGIREAVLANAPQAEHGFFTVPKVIE